MNLDKLEEAYSRSAQCECILLGGKRPDSLCGLCREAKQYVDREEARWQALTEAERIEELRQQIKALTQRVNWDGRIG